MFKIHWSRDWDDMTIDFHDGGVWLYLTRTNRWSNGAITVPLDYVPALILGM